MKEKFEFRSVFNEKSIRQTAKQIKNVHPSFQENAFISATLEGFDALSFGDRNSKITDQLFYFLPDTYTKALKILVASLGEPLIEEGHPGALRLLGVDPEIAMKSAKLNILSPHFIAGSSFSIGAPHLPAPHLYYSGGL